MRIIILILFLGGFLIGCTTNVEFKPFSEKEEKLLSQRFDPDGEMVNLFKVPQLQSETFLCAVAKFYDIANVIFIPVEIPGAGSKLFTLDTGCPVCVLGYPIISALDTKLLQGPDEVITFYGIYNSRHFFTTLVPSIKIGEVVLQDIPSLVPRKRGHASIHGIKIFEYQGTLGLNVLRPFNVTIDFREKEILFYLPGNRNFSRVEKTAFLETPLVGWPKTDKIIVSGYIGNKGPFKLEIDTGYRPADLMLFKDISKLTGLADDSIARVTIGGFTMEGIDFKSTERIFSDFDGLIGLSFLKRYKVSFNFQKGIMYWSKP